MVKWLNRIIMRPAAKPPQKTIPHNAGVLSIIMLLTLMFVGLAVILLDDYSLSALYTEFTLYWLEPPGVSRGWIAIAMVLTALVGHFAVPTVYYVGKTGRPGIAIWLNYRKLDDDIVEIWTITGKRIMVHKDRVKFYLLSIWIFGEYKYYIGDEETIILEGDNLEVSQMNILRKRMEAAEQEASLWQQKYMELLEAIHPYMKTTGGDGNGSD